MLGTLPFVSNRSREGGKKASFVYNKAVAFNTLRYAILKQLVDPNYLFRDVIEAHFVLKAKELRQTMRQYVRHYDSVSVSHEELRAVCGFNVNHLSSFKGLVDKIEEAVSNLIYKKLSAVSPLAEQQGVDHPSLLIDVVTSKPQHTVVEVFQDAPTTSPLVVEITEVDNSDKVIEVSGTRTDAMQTADVVDLSTEPLSTSMCEVLEEPRAPNGSMAVLPLVIDNLSTDLGTTVVEVQDDKQTLPLGVDMSTVPIIELQ